MALADLNRTNDTAIATLKVSDITPVNWHRFPAPISKAMTDKIYIPVFTWNGGIFGDETVAETNVLVDDHAVGDYGPRNLAEKMAWPGAPNSVVPSEATSGGQVVTAINDYTQSTDITRPRGWLEPDDPYTAPPGAGANPTITSLAPNTIAAGTPSPLAVVVTGTNFTQWTTLETGGVSSPYVQYNSPTKLTILMDPLRSVPGVVVVKVVDHGVKSAGTNFTYT